KTGTWALQMASSVYGLSVAPGGTGLRHLHWGAPVSLADLSSYPRPVHEVLNAELVGWGADEALEYTAFGGRRFDEPCLKVEYPDGTRGVEWHVAGHQTERHEGTVTLEVELVDD